MKDAFKFVDLIGFISFIPFLIPENILTLYIKIIICLIGLILFLIYKLIYFSKYVLKQKENLIKINENRNILANKFEETNEIIDNLKYVNNNYQKIFSTLEQSLVVINLSKDTDNQFVSNLLKLILTYKDHMEDIKNGR